MTLLFSPRTDADSLFTDFECRAAPGGVKVRRGCGPFGIIVVIALAPVVEPGSKKPGHVRSEREGVEGVSCPRDLWWFGSAAAARRSVAQGLTCEREEKNMTLLGPTSEDLRKIHAEVNQVANHRFLITTLGITLFGVVMAWMIPDNPPSTGGTVGGLVYTVSILLCLSEVPRITISPCFRRRTQLCVSSGGG